MVTVLRVTLYTVVTVYTGSSRVTRTNGYDDNMGLRGDEGEGKKDFVAIEASSRRVHIHLYIPYCTKRTFFSIPLSPLIQTPSTRSPSIRCGIKIVRKIVNFRPSRARNSLYTYVSILFCKIFLRTYNVRART